MKRESWASSLGFILAVAGSAIGLGNIWKFPYMAGLNGGGTFVLVYLICVLCVGLPVMCAELAIGRATRRNVINAMGKIELISAQPWVRFAMVTLCLGFGYAFAQERSWLMTGVSILGMFFFAVKGFKVLGWIATAVALGILSYYAVIGGWIVEYVWQAASGGLSFDGASIQEAGQHSAAFFVSYIGNPWRVLVGFFVFMGLTAAMIFGGIRAGIERICTVLMPMLFVLVLVVIVRSLTLPGAWDGVVFLLKPTMAAFTPSVLLMALGQVFFSLSLGMAISVTYGSYLGKEHNIMRSAGWVAVLDTMLAILAGLAIFPAVFATGADPAQGPGLIFGVLPAVFNTMWGGPIWATAFFGMLFIAAITSSASLLECGATVFIERLRKGHKRGSRNKAVLIGFVGCFVLGLLSVFSTTSWDYLPGANTLADVLMGNLNLGNWLDTLDNVASNWVLPFSALGSTLLVGWCWMPRRAAPALLSSEDRDFPQWVLMAWAFLVRWIAPLAIVAIFLNMTGFIKL